MQNNPLLVVLGPTASGKTKLGVGLATALKTDLISADSRQIFKDMDIGTGKDLHEYGTGLDSVHYHLINIREAGEDYHVNAFKEDFYEIYTDLRSKQKIPLLCGGTGMYIHSLLQDHIYTVIPVNIGLRENLAAYPAIELKRILAKYPELNRAHADLSSVKRIIRAIEVAEYLENNILEPRQKIAMDPLIIGLQTDVNLRRQRIKQRLDERIRAGLIEEVETLLKRGIPAEKLIFYGLEYKFITSFIIGKLSRKELEERLYYAICQFAKRQMTFFRKMEKDGVLINWIDAGQTLVQIQEQALALVVDKWRL